ncbi:MAG: dTDP-glucose 4,6-dehydratase [Deltaproteobacteria bacterium]|nr:dTDP-glucose 4,6-dehydratase [Deltaproteobacteria bacterium]
MKLLVTGGCGFIGANFIRYVLNKYADYQVVNLDKLTYAGNLENLAGLEEESGGRYSFVRGDIRDAALVAELLGREIDVVVNFAAESHVDRSIEDASVFVRTNVEGTQVLLEAARKSRVGLYVQISTDEVYGSLGPSGAFSEKTPLDPRSPYSASKAAADLLVLAYAHTYGLPVLITRCSNNYGPFQFPEKLIPLMLTNALEGLPLPVYGDGLNVRDWIYVGDHCRGVDLIIHQGTKGEVYNLGGASELTNLDLVGALLRELAIQKGHQPGCYDGLIKFVTDRLGHDRRYAMDFTKIQTELGWTPGYTLAQGMKETVAWYLQNEAWWRRIKTGEYLDYYQRMYAGR